MQSFLCPLLSSLLPQEQENREDTCRILQLGNTDHLPEQLLFYTVSEADADPFLALIYHKLIVVSFVSQYLYFKRNVNYREGP